MVLACKISMLNRVILPKVATECGNARAASVFKAPIVSINLRCADKFPDSIGEISLVKSWKERVSMVDLLYFPCTWFRERLLCRSMPELELKIYLIILCSLCQVLLSRPFEYFQIFFPQPFPPNFWGWSSPESLKEHRFKEIDILINSVLLFGKGSFWPGRCLFHGRESFRV